MPIVGTPRTYHKKFKYIVEIDGVLRAGFSKASELSVEVASSQYWEGGALIPHKSPGRLTFADLTLERGAFRCPWCGSTDTRLENVFGPTPCRSLRYCNGCRQPFEQFKTI